MLAALTDAWRFAGLTELRGIEFPQESSLKHLRIPESYIENKTIFIPVVFGLLVL